jgi:hypothetical protein
LSSVYAEGYAFTDIIGKDGRLIMWLVLLRSNMTARIVFTGEPKYQYTEKLLRFATFWMQHELGIHPKDVEIILSNPKDETLSSKRFRKITRTWQYNQ